MFFTENGLFHFVAFINGGIFGFDGFWLEAEPGIRRTVRKILRRKKLVDRLGRVDEHAGAEIEGMVIGRLLTAARREGAAVFSPDRSHDSPAGLCNWMKSLVTNCVSDYLEKFHGSRTAVKTVSLEGLELNPPSASSRDGNEVIDEVIRREKIESVRNCLAELEPNDRSLLLQAYYEKKSQRDIARDLGVSPATAFRRIQDARENFIRIMRARQGRGPAAADMPDHRLAT